VPSGRTLTRASRDLSQGERFQQWTKEEKKGKRMPKDILILMPDTQRADWLGCYGAEFVNTPNIDRLAAEGARFTRATTPCPICMPARTSFLTGMYPHNHGQWHNVGRLQDTQESFLHPLKALGYRSCHVGKSHLHPHGSGRDLREAEPFMNAIGWDDVFETTGPWSTRTTTSILTDWMKENDHLETFLDDYAKRKDARVRNLWPSPLPDGKHPDDFIAQTAVDYIQNSDRSQPMCLFVGIGGPHDPWDCPKQFDHYDPKDMPAPLPTDPAPEWLKEPALTHHKEIMKHNPDVTAEEWARVRSLYSGRVEHVDHCFGKVLDAWSEARGDDTWIFYWSDHGEMLGDKNRTAKSVYYQGSDHIPMIVRPPKGANAPVVCDGLVGLTDLTATVLEAAGCETMSRNVFGKSLLPVFDDPSSVGSDLSFSEISEFTMVTDGRWKMVVDRGNNVLQLYDLEADPGESLNLAGKPDQLEVEERLKLEILKFHLKTPYHQHRDVNG